MTDLSDLIEKLEAAECGSRELDGAVAMAVGHGGIVATIHWDTHTEVVNSVPAYTTSIDAALTLVPEGWFWTCGLCDLTGHVTIGPDYNGPHRERLMREWPEDIWHEGISVDLAPGGTIDAVCLAICIAALRARQADTGEAGE